MRRCHCKRCAAPSRSHEHGYYTCDHAIAAIARNWVAAESERKLRKRERAYAWILLKALGGVEKADYIPPDDFASKQWIVTTDEQREALSVARAAEERYERAWRRAGGLRGALTRLAKSDSPTTEPDTLIHSAYAALCEREIDAALRRVGGPKWGEHETLSL